MGETSAVPDPLDRLPHTGAARLPDRVLRLEPGASVVACRSLAARDACLNAGGWLPSSLLVELMAQVGGLLMDEEPAAPGGHALLAGIRRLHLHAAARAGDTVVVECGLRRRMGDLFLIECRGVVDGRTIAHGSIHLRRMRGGAPWSPR